MSNALMEKICQARIIAAEHMPYYARGLFSLSFHARKSVTTLAVDRYFRIYFGEKFVEQCSKKELAGGIIHELEHLLRDHHRRSGNPPSSPEAWNVASDMEINDDLRNFVDLPAGGVFPELLGFPAGELAEAYYRQLLKNASTLRIGGGGSGTSRIVGNDANGKANGQSGCSGGSGVDGIARPWEIGGPSEQNPGVDGITAQAIIEGTIIDAQNHKSIGKIPGYLQRMADARKPAKVDWRRELRAAIAKGLTQRKGTVDYTYRRPSRRQVVLAPYIQPGMVEYQPDIALIIDTSGSMSKDDLEMALAETAGVLRAVGHTQKTAVLSVDSAVHVVQRVFRASEITLQGGGGTNMGTGLRKIAEFKPRPDVVVIFTDGHTPWPSERPPFKRIIVCLIGSGADKNIPSWAHGIQVA